MIFKLYNCDVGYKINGVTYIKNNVVSVNIDDPEQNELTRGSNATDTVGIAFRTGLREPKVWTVPFMEMSAAEKAVLDNAYTKQVRMEVFAIDRDDGSMKMARNAVLANKPQQLSLDDSPESMEVSLIFKTFDSTETHKS